MLQYVSPLVLLLISNVFMTFAWYGHLKNFKSSALWIVILASWGIALFEYIFQVPANRLGSEVYTLPQLKIMQEVITMVVFAGFSYWYMGQPLKLDYLWASLCLIGAVYFLFR
ncbi:DMT family protein [Bdellovibrio sp. HCB274]|uniref:DMT family protein n=1 Tax=Bdellovibrio sp. HCB274 TaxID=3394361 RepID=UPI0039B62580